MNNNYEQLAVAQAVPATSMSPKKLPESRTVNALVIGELGSGKTSVVGGFKGITEEGKAGFDSVTKGLKKFEVRVDNDLIINVIDTMGSIGDWKRDLVTRLQLQRDLLECDIQAIHVVLMVIPSSRFTSSKEAILDMEKTFNSKKFRDRIQVVITHAPDGILTEEFMKPIVERLGFLGTTREEILNKVHFVDLLHPNTFDSAVGQELVDAKWFAAQEKLHRIVRNARKEESVQVWEIESLSRVQQLLLVYRTEVLTVLALLVIIGLAWAALHHYGVSLQQLGESAACQVENFNLSDQVKTLKSDLAALQQPKLQSNGTGLQPPAPSASDDIHIGLIRSVWQTVVQGSTTVLVYLW